MRGEPRLAPLHGGEPLHPVQAVAGVAVDGQPVWRLGNANGTFQAATTYASGTACKTHGVLLLDVNGDGFADLISMSASPRSEYSL